MLLQLVQQGIKFLQDSINNLSVEFDQDKIKVQQGLQNAAAEMKQMAERLNHFQGNNDCLLTHPCRRLPNYSTCNYYYGLDG